MDKEDDVMPGKIKCSFYSRACESESGIKEEEELQTFDSLMQSERVLLIKKCDFSLFLFIFIWYFLCG